jgi:hypothetical protein
MTKRLRNVPEIGPLLEHLACDECGETDVLRGAWGVRRLLGPKPGARYGRC